ALWELLWNLIRRKKHAELEDDREEWTDLPAGDETEDDVAEIQVRLPSDADMSGELAEQVLLAIASVSPKTSFELIGVGGKSVLQYAIPKSHAASVRRTLEAYVPDAVLSTDEILKLAWENAGYFPKVADFGLKHEFMLPIATNLSLKVDPLLGFLATLD